ncbi:erythromycin esterase family protein [Flammeovirga sp. EKP202]|uniref:carboxypeptidase-like regulatory domain-containing protein n=1 Tax=Flammeovirga sp. EKP202 TaxID=2770592 RepID=UPI00165EF892|nr:erythromycin esterase family protein [Flammeovirga sp. EKP202]MBD0401604.1 erythromycin esterase family protein [Flammeovirga sp. EKP202]
MRQQLKAMLSICFLLLNATLFAQQKLNFHYYDTLNFHQFSALKEDIGDARIVLLGEPDHNHGNIFTAKTEVMKMLHQEMGFEIVAFESGFYDLNKSHEAIARGENIKFAYTNSIFSILTSQEEFHPFMDYVAENYETLKVHGFDNQLSGYYAQETLIKDFAPYFNSEEEYQDWENCMEFIQDYDFPKALDIEKFLNHNNYLKEAIAKSDQVTKKDLIQTLHFISETAKDYYYNKSQKKTQEEFKAKDSNVRDRLMGENLLYLANKYHDKKIIVWGATGHLMNKIRGVLEELDEFNPMGSYIKEKWGDKAYILAFTGQDDDIYTEDNIEDHFYESGNAFAFLSLNEKVVFKSNVIGTEGGGIEELKTDWSLVFDGMFFVNQLKKGTYKGYDCGESQLKSDNIQQSNTKGTTFTFELKKGQKKDLPVYYFKDNSTFEKQVGIVFDQNTKEPIPYANVFTSESKTGTSTNDKGIFEIGLPSPQDSIVISSLGYETITIASSKTNLEIGLKPKVEEMSTLTISSEPLTAKSIMKKVIQNIPKNYNQGSFSYDIDADMITQTKKNGVYYVEREIDLHRNIGYQSWPLFGYRDSGNFTKLISARGCPIDSLKSDSPSYTEFDPKKSSTMLRVFTHNDVIAIRNNNFLNKGKLSKYDLEFSDVIIEDGKEIYVIKYKAKNLSFRSSVFMFLETINGVLHINAEDYALLKVDCYVVHNEKESKKFYEGDRKLKRHGAKVASMPFTKQETTYKKNKDGYYYLDELIGESNLPFYPTYNHLKVSDIKLGERNREEEVN